MNSDAAEQVVRLSLEGTEIAVRLTGAAAKNLAAAIYAVLKNHDRNKLKGRQRLTAMLKSGKELTVFTVGERNLGHFAREAKRYGIVYCALRAGNKAKDGQVDIMVRAEDAAKINRIVERFHFAAVDAASLRTEIEKAREEKAGQKPPEQQRPEKSEEDRLLDDMLGAPAQKEGRSQGDPTLARTETSPPSAPTSTQPERAAEGAANGAGGRPSVRRELREIQAQRRQEEKTPPARGTEPQKKAKQKTTRHQQPARKKRKGRER